MKLDKIVKALIDNGRAEQLNELIIGTSKYCVEEPADAVPINDENRKFWQLTMNHLHFISKHGQEKNSMEIDGYYECAYPDEFEKWMELGCPGLSQIELNEYLKDNPL